MRYLIFLLTVCFGPAGSGLGAEVIPPTGFDHTHSAWNEALDKYLGDDGKVQYTQIKAEISAPLNPYSTYLAQLTAVKAPDFEKWTKEQQLAFLINAYNALTIKLVVDHYPVATIDDIGSVFKSPGEKPFFSLFDGTVKTLDELEKKQLRVRTQDPRVYIALNKAAISSPRLATDAYAAIRLNDQLDEASRDFLADKTLNQYEPKSGTLWLSRVFDWYAEDFDGPYGGVVKFVDKYGPENAKKAIASSGKIRFLKFNNGLNDAVKGPKQPHYPGPK
jgi:hypothetical protein